MDIAVYGPDSTKIVYKSNDRLVGDNIARWNQQVVIFRIDHQGSYSVIFYNLGVFILI